MNIGNKAWRSIWLGEDGCSVGVIDQRKLPHVFKTKTLRTWQDAADAIKSMVVRGAPLIGVTGAYGLMLALQSDATDKALNIAIKNLMATRPTAVNLRWALERMRKAVFLLPQSERAEAAKREVGLIVAEDVACCDAIGTYGLSILQKLAEDKCLKGEDLPIQILTHCNAGWLATVDWGTALAPIYKAFRKGVNLHVWVDETRPRNQGASLTSYELGCEGIPHTVIVDNAGGYLMQNNQVDLVLVGTDRTTKTGDVCNKIGTYLKALAAYDNNIPFYVALPISTIDWSIKEGLAEIPIEIRSENEVKQIPGRLLSLNGGVDIASVKLVPDFAKTFNPAFDITPARLVTAFITDKGILAATEEGLEAIYSCS
ncbi:S-methyl-5-thioribose-1-phosphate isomerase [Prochlorococcus sp. MIT 1300]|uniref:S-methyl-5-thioribose-1-phosphate isomerase n=1 Tax=Prochlorococcus sp. MIT 1300 TaxID=3096218 RepID=UPI002A756EB0|nr:S-methyl-5-thioribose-1-phosphate isomerase [Prochlorococcus sp. MIT 1300]